MRHATLHSLSGGIEIRLVSAPYFLGTKLEAFLGRGDGDFMGSHDLEDVVSLLDGFTPPLTPGIDGRAAKVLGHPV